MMEGTKERKDDHLRIALEEKVETAASTWLEYVKLIHRSLPECNSEEVELETTLLGETFSAPILIEGMTGGTDLGAKVNRKLANIAERYNLPMMVGSQRVAIEAPDLSWTFRAARENTDIYLLGNIGAPQIIHYDEEEITRVVEMINADALAIHLNPLQEVIQPDGDVNYKGVVTRLQELTRTIDVPILVKETGAGISKESAKILSDIGVDAIDVSGKGGTNWSVIEEYRLRERNESKKASLGETFKNWGVPTAVSILEAKKYAKDEDIEIIASGGIRNGIDIAKSLAIGADFAGFALPFLRSLDKGIEMVEKLVERIKLELRVALFLTGSKTIEELKVKEPVLLPPLTNWINQRDLSVS